MAEQNQVLEAMVLLQYYVASPERKITVPVQPSTQDCNSIQQRLSKGFDFILTQNLDCISLNLSNRVLHFYGAESALVNDENAFKGQNTTLVEVSGVGMRILQESSGFAQKYIEKELGII